MTSLTSREWQAYWRLMKRLNRALRSEGNRDEIADIADDLDVISLYTESALLRRRCNCAWRHAYGFDHTGSDAPGPA